MKIKIKICGITKLQDALMATKLGAFALGFNFYEKSSRYIKPTEAKEIIQELPANIITVGVFVNATLSSIKKIQKESGIQQIQLHGNETIKFCEKISQPVIKAIKPRSIDDEPKINNNITFLLDGYSPSHYGGSGNRIDWQLAAEIAKKQPIILAGGITPENINKAILQVKPMMIDLCSGVEKSPGDKSHERMKKLFLALGES